MSGLAHLLRPKTLSGLSDDNRMFYVYVLYSKKDKKLYIGRTDDLRKRIYQHTHKYVDSTKNRGELILIYYEAFYLKESSVKQELLYKTGQGRRILKKRLIDIVNSLKNNCQGGGVDNRISL